MPTIYLLDVNLLIALLWPEHELSNRAEAWFARAPSRIWATCSITQAGFVRIVSNPSATPRSPGIGQAVALLKRNTELENHRFLSGEADILNHLARFAPRLQGYRQVTDAYLLGIAMHHNLILATLDKAFLQLAAPAFAQSIELID